MLELMGGLGIERDTCINGVTQALVLPANSPKGQKTISMTSLHFNEVRVEFAECLFPIFISPSVSYA